MATTVLQDGKSRIAKLKACKLLTTMRNVTMTMTTSCTVCGYSRPSFTKEKLFHIPVPTATVKAPKVSAVTSLLNSNEKK